MRYAKIPPGRTDQKKQYRVTSSRELKRSEQSASWSNYTHVIPHKSSGMDTIVSRGARSQSHSAGVKQLVSLGFPRVLAHIFSLRRDQRPLECTSHTKPRLNPKRRYHSTIPLLHLRAALGMDCENQPASRRRLAGLSNNLTGPCR